MASTVADTRADAAAPAPFRSTGPAGHRARMRERLLSRGAEALADYEILEMLLFLGIPRRDTKPLAKALINRFGSLSDVLCAPPELLAAAGLGDEAVAVLRMPQQASLRLAAAEARARPVLNNWDRLLEYFDTALAGAMPGQLRGLLLDNRNRLLADELLDDAPDRLPQALAGRALALHATALILVRVLPAGPVEKSLPKRDAALAATLSKALSALSIVLHDHMLVGGGSWVSLRQKGML
jgi:DNA repair protein RadC